MLFLPLLYSGSNSLCSFWQTGVYHHVTGIDASSSASLAAYVNTLTFSPLDKTHKVVSGIYWLDLIEYRRSEP